MIIGLNDYIVSEYMRVEPIEYDNRKKEKGKSPRIIRHRGIVFNSILSFVELKQALSKIRIRKKIKKDLAISESKEGIILWKYLGKPEVGIDKEQNVMCATKDEVTLWGMRACQVQAAICLKILKRVNLVECYSVSATYNPYKMGVNLEDVEITFEAIRELIRNYDKSGSGSLADLVKRGRVMALKRRSKKKKGKS